VAVRRRQVLVAVAILTLVVVVGWLRPRPQNEPASNVVQTGTYVVPEPQHYALFAGAGLLAFAAWRRRRN
jgi:MYXO-CTERM domain-containing protein